MTIPAFLRSPLLHFFLLGGLVFGVYSLKNPPMDDGPGEDVIPVSYTHLTLPTILLV